LTELGCLQGKAAPLILLFLPEAELPAFFMHLIEVRTQSHNEAVATQQNHKKTTCNGRPLID
jgi:hypothetical protein